MVFIHPIPTKLTSFTFVFIVFRLTLCEIGINTQQIVLSESITSTTVLQQTVEVTANYHEQAVLINATIPFENGICTNPVIEIYREAIDNNLDNEYLEFFYGAFNNESSLVRCIGFEGEEQDACGSFVSCGVFELPVGDYTMLEFFILQSENVESLCGDEADEEGPERSLGVRFAVSCQVEVECGEDDPTEEGEEESEESGSGSSSEDGARTMRKVEHNEDMQVSPIYLKDNESNKEEVDNIPVRIDCNSYFNFLMMIVLCICLCWIAQCALFYRYRKN